MFWYRAKIFLLAVGVVAGYGSAFHHYRHYGWDAGFHHDCFMGHGPAPTKPPMLER